MLGLPNLPRKLPSRNWMIFWAITGSFTAALVYDKREKNRATAKWRHAVEHLATEKMGSANALPRKLTIYLDAPPGDGLRAAQDHFIEYAKPVLSASGLDWEFVQGRQQGDVRAAVAEKIRRVRRKEERPNEELADTEENMLEKLRDRMGLEEYEGVKGDIVVGRHTWKEYIRGMHEGWLGPLDAPPMPEPVEVPKTIDDGAVNTEDNKDEMKEEKKDEEKKDEEKKDEGKKDEKPKRPPQPQPYNSPESYAESTMPNNIPNEFAPSTVLWFPHRVGFRHTFVRLGWFLTRRKLADEIGREVAAVCFAASRDWRETDGQYEQQLMLLKEEDGWPKSVWKEEEDRKVDDIPAEEKNKPPKELIWASPMRCDPRIVDRMRRFELLPEDEARAAQIKVPESEVEGWIKRNIRGLINWGVESWNSKPFAPNVGNIDSE